MQRQNRCSAKTNRGWAATSFFKTTTDPKTVPLPATSILLRKPCTQRCLWAGVMLRWGLTELLALLLLNCLLRRWALGTLLHLTSHRTKQASPKNSHHSESVQEQTSPPPCLTLPPPAVQLLSTRTYFV